MLSAQSPAQASPAPRRASTLPTNRPAVIKLARKPRRLLSVLGGVVPSHFVGGTEAAFPGTESSPWRLPHPFKQFVHAGDTLIWSPGHKVFRILEAVAAVFPETRQAVRCFGSDNGLHLAILVPGPSLIQIVVPTNGISKLELPAYLEAHPPYKIAFPDNYDHIVKDAFLSPDGAELAVLSERGALHVYTHRRPSQSGDLDPPGGHWSHIDAAASFSDPLGGLSLAWSPSTLTIVFATIQDDGDDEGEGSADPGPDPATGVLSLLVIRQPRGVACAPKIHAWRAVLPRIRGATAVGSSAGGFFVMGAAEGTFSTSMRPVQVYQHRSSGQVAILVDPATRTTRATTSATAGSNQLLVMLRIDRPWPGGYVSPIAQTMALPLSRSAGSTSTPSVVLKDPSRVDERLNPDSQVVAMAWAGHPDLPLLVVLARGGKMALVSPSAQIAAIDDGLVGLVHSAAPLDRRPSLVDLFRSDQATFLPRGLRPEAAALTFGALPESARDAKRAVFLLAMAPAPTPTSQGPSLPRHFSIMVSDGLLAVQCSFPMPTSSDGFDTAALPWQLPMPATLGEVGRSASLALREWTDVQTMGQPLSRLTTASQAGVTAPEGVYLESAMSRGEAVHHVVADHLAGLVLAAAATSSSSSSAGRLSRYLNRPTESDKGSFALLSLLRSIDQLFLPSADTTHPQLVLACVLRRLALDSRPHLTCSIVPHVLRRAELWMGAGAVEWTMGWAHFWDQMLANSNPMRASWTENWRMHVAAMRGLAPVSGEQEVSEDEVAGLVAALEENGAQTIEVLSSLPHEFLACLTRGDWTTAADVATATLDTNDGSLQDVELIQDVWLNLAIRVVNQDEIITVPGSLATSRPQELDARGLCEYAATTGQPVLSPAAVWKFAARALRCADALARVAQNALLHLDRWAPGTWASHLLVASTVGRGTPTESGLPLSLAALDALLTWSMRVGDVTCSTFLAQVAAPLHVATTALDPASYDGIQAAILGHHALRLIARLADAMRESVAVLPDSDQPNPIPAPPTRDLTLARRRSSAAKLSAATTADLCRRARTRPRVAYLLHQAIYEHDSEHWDKRDASVLVPLMEWARCAAVLAVSAGAQAVPTGPIFLLIRLLFAIECRTIVAEALDAAHGEWESAYSVEIMERVVLLAHYADIFNPVELAELVAQALAAAAGVNARADPLELACATVAAHEPLVTPRMAELVLHAVRANGDGGSSPTVISLGADDEYAPDHAAVMALAEDPRFLAFSAEVMAVIRDHLLPPANVYDLYDRMMHAWLPRFPPVIERDLYVRIAHAVAPPPPPTWPSGSVARSHPEVWSSGSIAMSQGTASLSRSGAWASGSMADVEIQQDEGDAVDNNSPPDANDEDAWGSVGASAERVNVHVDLDAPFDTDPADAPLDTDPVDSNQIDDELYRGNEIDVDPPADPDPDDSGDVLESVTHVSTAAATPSVAATDDSASELFPVAPTPPPPPAADSWRRRPRPASAAPRRRPAAPPRDSELHALIQEMSGLAMHLSEAVKGVQAMATAQPAPPLPAPPVEGVRTVERSRRTEEKKKSRAKDADKHGKRKRKHKEVSADRPSGIGMGIPRSASFEMFVHDRDVEAKARTVEARQTSGGSAARIPLLYSSGIGKRVSSSRHVGRTAGTTTVVKTAGALPLLFSR
ncbi:hypothetical protein AMAG_08973 [Allomyces macrogynus ATCC 38327]|uniref:Uncharacterized protein n=1 Tax=Allomyces macrogynus (strain ATCC 38327) TaxID=578462 RepID=A0A0L0SN41_ALLM3|nr:hypothetical protein AMAG_08973 [Allomyces macrogynus ATCC 38327]|eukprot:KNE63912.1 hypothetical protein AMAG_08973 [Allomyces macrogynus ATCC 38327]